MHDTLDYISQEPIHRQYHHNEMTFSMVYAYTRELRAAAVATTRWCTARARCCGKMPGDEWQQLARLRALLAYMWAHPGKQLLFMGSEFGQGAEWARGAGLDWWLLDCRRPPGRAAAGPAT